MTKNITHTLLAIIGMSFVIPHSAHAVNYQNCAEQTRPLQDVSGRWIAAVGPIDLKSNGDLITGIYNKGDWALTLQYSSDRRSMFGRWDHLNGLSGPVIFFLDANLCIRHAKWGGTGNASCTPASYSACVHNWAIHGRALSSD